MIFGLFIFFFLKPQSTVRKKHKAQEAEKRWHNHDSSGISIHYFSFRTVQDAMFFQPAASYNLYAYM